MGELRILSEQTVKRCLGDEIDACFEVCAEAYRYYGRVGSVLSEPSSLYLQLPSDQPKKCRLKGAHFGDLGVAGFRLASPGFYLGSELSNRPTGGVGRRELAAPATYGSHWCSDTPLVTS